MRSHTHRALATALTAGVAVALVPAGAAQAQPLSGSSAAATKPQTQPNIAQAEQKVAAARAAVNAAVSRDQELSGS